MVVEGLEDDPPEVHPEVHPEGHPEGHPDGSRHTLPVETKYPSDTDVKGDVDEHYEATNHHMIVEEYKRKGTAPRIDPKLQVPRK